MNGLKKKGMGLVFIILCLGQVNGILALSLEDFDTSMEGGSGANWRNTSENSFYFELEYDYPPWNQERYWFMFNVTGHAQGVSARFQVDITDKICWSNAYAPVVSYDGGDSWSYIGRGAVREYDYGERRVLEFNITFQGERCLVAAAIPYQYSRLQSFVQNITSDEGLGSVCEVSSYPSTEGRQVYIFTVTDFSEITDKPTIWVIAGQEPCETWPQWAAQGLVEYLLSNSTAARSLLRQHIWKVTPMINPDGSYHGLTQQNIENVDLTREWGKSSSVRAKEVNGTVNAVESWLGEGHTLDAFIDLHSWLGDETKIFAPSPSHPKLKSAYAQADLESRLDYPNTMWGYSSNEYLRGGSSMSIGYMVDRYGANSVLLEINQFGPDIKDGELGIPATVQNLKQLGEQLANSLSYAKYTTGLVASEDVTPVEPDTPEANGETPSSWGLHVVLVVLFLFACTVIISLHRK